MNGSAFLKCVRVSVEISTEAECFRHSSSFARWAAAQVQRDRELLLSWVHTVLQSGHS
jgi:hypothetical protein